MKKYPGREFQTFGVDAHGQVTHAAPRQSPRMSQRIAERIQRKWEARRARYLTENPGNYPLRSCSRPTVWLVMQEVGKPETRQWFRIRKEVQND